MADSDRLRLARTDGVGPITYRRLVDRYGSATAAIDALPDLARSAGRVPAATPSGNEIAMELERLARLGGRIMALGDADYPPMLAVIDDAPAILAILGDAASLSGRSVAVVGSRNASVNGMRLAELLARELAEAGLAVVSGMARGIDAAAHEGALSAGSTIACVAGGLDQPYPPENASLQSRIAHGGCVLSEAPLGTAPQARHFPRRNRIIAGLALGVVVVEAATRSGSLSTARMALGYGREVFAVPGSPLDPRCRGTNELIKQNEAHLTETAQDVLAIIDQPRHVGRLAEQPAEWPGSAANPDEVEAARLLLPEWLGPAPTSVDDLVRRCQFSAAAVLAALSDMELAGRVEWLPGQRVALLVELRT